MTLPVTEPYDKPNPLIFKKCCDALKTAWDNDMVGYEVVIHNDHNKTILASWRGFSKVRKHNITKNCPFCKHKLTLKDKYK